MWPSLRSGKENDKRLSLTDASFSFSFFFASLLTACGLSQRSLVCVRCCPPSHYFFFQFTFSRVCLHSRFHITVDSSWWRKPKGEEKDNEVDSTTRTRLENTQWARLEKEKKSITAEQITPRMWASQPFCFVRWKKTTRTTTRCVSLFASNVNPEKRKKRPLATRQVPHGSGKNTRTCWSALCAYAQNTKKKETLHKRNPYDFI